MKHLFFIPASFLAFLMFVLTGCPSNSPSAKARDDDSSREAPRERIERSDREYEERRNRDKDRDQVISDFKKKVTGGSACEGDKDCEELCDEIYDRKRDRDDCEDLSTRQVEILAEIHELLEDPDEDTLEGLDKDAFEALINISIEPLDDLVNKYTRSESKSMLAWIASDEEAAAIFAKEDDEFKIFKKLLGEIKNDDIEALSASIDSSDNFMELMVEAGNEEAGEWLHDFMDSEACKSGGVDSAPCLRKYCKIASKMTKDYAKDLLDFEYFEKYIESIIEEGVNGKCWTIGHRTVGDDNGPSRTRMTHGTISDGVATDGHCKGKTDAHCEPFEDLDDMLDATDDDQWWEGVCSFNGAKQCIPGQLPASYSG